MAADAIHPRGEGDQSGDIDSEFRQWYAGLFDALGRSLGAPTAAPQDVVKGHRYEDRVAGALGTARNADRRIRRATDADPGKSRAAAA